jgi:hypothetical protein
MGPRQSRPGILAQMPASTIKGKLQWGRDNLVPELTMRRLWGETGQPLQWGRDNLVAEFAISSTVCNLAGHASMGPRQSRRGITARAGRAGAEDTRFNGAATISSRNSQFTWSCNSIIYMLQWVVTISSRNSRSSRQRDCKVSASMGPRQSRRGIGATQKALRNGPFRPDFRAPPPPDQR